MAAVPQRPAVLSLDTSREAEDLQVKIWRSMTAAQKLDLALTASSTARQMARAGLRDRHPDASEDEITQRLALITLGEDPARRAYPDIGRFIK